MEIARPGGWQPEYDKLAWQPLDLGLLHLRWSHAEHGRHRRQHPPFQYGDYTFAHNGAIHPQERLGEMLPPE